jgi:hypothetical protein
MLLAGQYGHSAVKSLGCFPNTRRHGFGALTSKEKHHLRPDLCERARIEVILLHGCYLPAKCQSVGASLIRCGHDASFRNPAITRGGRWA